MFGRDGYFTTGRLPQPYFYLYYIRFRDMKRIRDGSDKIKCLQNLPQPIFYLYYMRLRDMKRIRNGSDGRINQTILPRLIDEIYRVIEREK